MIIKKIDHQNRKFVDSFIVKHCLHMVIHGEDVDLGNADGLCAEQGNELVGLITWRIENKDFEILSLNSVKEHCDVGTRLLGSAVSKAKSQRCNRVKLITTNDCCSALFSKAWFWCGRFSS